MVLLLLFVPRVSSVTTLATHSVPNSPFWAGAEAAVDPEDDRDALIRVYPLMPQQTTPGMSFSYLSVQ